jgi:hypothetical protein
MADGDYRDIWISAAAFLVVFGLASILFKDEPTVRTTTGMIAFIGSILLREFIDSRELRRRRKASHQDSL